jgi:hypothetical protein
VWTSHSFRPLESASVTLAIIHLLFSIYYVCYSASVKYIIFPDTYQYGNETLISLPTFRTMFLKSNIQFVIDSARSDMRKSIAM